MFVLFPGGDVTSSLNVACYKHSPEKWPGLEAFRALLSWLAQQELAGTQSSWQTASPSSYIVTSSLSL